MPTKSFNTIAPPYKIVLRNIFDCFVSLERLSEAQITRAIEKQNGNQNHSINLASNQIDHNYALVPSVRIVIVTISINYEKKLVLNLNNNVIFLLGNCSTIHKWIITGLTREFTCFRWNITRFKREFTGFRWLVVPSKWIITSKSTASSCATSDEGFVE